MLIWRPLLVTAAESMSRWAAPLSRSSVRWRHRRRLPLARQQLAGYVMTRSSEMGQRYVGILTDGRLWLAYHEVDGELREATQMSTASGDAGAEELLRWLEGVLATRRAILPTPIEIAERLGATSSSHALDYSTLAAIYDRDHPVLLSWALKRRSST